MRADINYKKLSGLHDKYDKLQRDYIISQKEIISLNAIITPLEADVRRLELERRNKH